MFRATALESVNLPIKGENYVFYLKWYIFLGLVCNMHALTECQILNDDISAKIANEKLIL